MQPTQEEVQIMTPERSLGSGLFLDTLFSIKKGRQGQDEKEEGEKYSRNDVLDEVVGKLVWSHAQYREEESVSGVRPVEDYHRGRTGEVKEAEESLERVGSKKVQSFLVLNDVKHGGSESSRK
ncbi:hypothetical protein R1flu_007152 [Riccia fluitans]|uniref:Uncharacterized protein n=1 Tax=Riccia fluitans TaxID=41844 RepID=A0ABD1YY13_9MARC